MAEVCADIGKEGGENVDILGKNLTLHVYII